MAERLVHVTISGRVQGVGYRAWVEREAVLRGLMGWVRNRRDGGVEAVFAGTHDGVEDMVAACHDGPPAAEVRSVDAANWSGPVGPDFIVLPTT